MWGLRVDLHIYFYRFHVRVPTVIAMTQRRRKKNSAMCDFVVVANWMICLRMSVENETNNHTQILILCWTIHARTLALAHRHQSIYLYFGCSCVLMQTWSIAYAICDSFVWFRLIGNGRSHQFYSPVGNWKSLPQRFPVQKYFSIEYVFINLAWCVPMCRVAFHLHRWNSK